MKAKNSEVFNGAQEFLSSLFLSSFLFLFSPFFLSSSLITVALVLSHNFTLLFIKV